MTAQISDTYLYKEEKYNIVAFSEPLTFRPQDYGLVPQGLSTACYNGYWCEYEITDTGLFLKNLYINTEDDNYPPINGISPFNGSRIEMKRLSIMGAHLYKEVNLPLSYTGRIVAGRDFLKKYYIHMGYQRAWSYGILLEFVFDEGRLIEIVDHSEMAELIRMEIEEDPKAFRKKLDHDVSAFVDNSFSLDIKVKCWWM